MKRTGRFGILRKRSDRQEKSSMNASEIYRVETTVSEDGVITVTGLPLHAGDKVEVTVRLQDDAVALYPLRGVPVEYLDPFGTIAEGDWDALQ